MRKIAVLFAFLITTNVFAHQDGESVAPLGADATEVQMQVVRDGAQDFCDGKEDDEREECVMDFFANHNLEEEPSCD
ncbi:MAG: hypothetical protein PSN35_04110 [Candidatus Thioglobus sp.]|uniref:hypothetical protein n=1 Tax=Candidatus Thioglobus sp. TaxID=2026721 RepID=UPI0026341EF0|nr:hypothetical protein [Candidatus Thioglobus sp.]MDC9727003.1 hypothetical protein [Candidatus Thioglobus sp.]